MAIRWACWGSVLWLAIMVWISFVYNRGKLQQGFIFDNENVFTYCELLRFVGCITIAITVTTTRNSSMIGLGWLTGTGFYWPRPPKRDKASCPATASTATSNVSSSCAYGGRGRLIVGFQPLMVISPTASWIRWCMQVYAFEFCAYRTMRLRCC